MMYTILHCHVNVWVAKVGMLVAVNLEKYQGRPLIGKVVEVSGKEVELEWLVGTHSEMWKQ